MANENTYTGFKYGFVFFIIIIFLLGLIFYDSQYKPIPTSDCQYGASTNFTGKIKQNCYYQSCQVGCKYFNEIKETGFKKKGAK